MNPNPFPVIAAEMLYRFCLWLYPKSFRRRFGQEMVQLFRDDTRRTLQQRGVLSLIGLCFLVFFDLFLTAIAEHLREGIHMPLDKLERFSGFAAFGAPMMLLTLVSPAFQDVVTTLRRALGLRRDPDGSIFVVLGTVLAAYALFGLYRRLAARPELRNAAFFGLSAAGSLFGLLEVFMRSQRLPDLVESILVFGAVLMFLAGMAGMGWLAWRNRTLGAWSFAPLLMAGALTAYVLTALAYAGDGLDVIKGLFSINLELALYTTGWWALGIGLLMPKRDEASPALMEAETMA